MTDVSSFTAFADERAASEPSWIGSLRREAIDRFEALGFPTRRHEDWRWTNLKPLTDARFRREEPGALSHVEASRLDPFAIEGFDAARVVLVNGRLVPELSELAALAPARAARVADIAGDVPEIGGELAKIAPHADRPFVALNTAYMDPLAIIVPEGVAIERPIHVVSVSSAPEGPVIAHPRVLLVVGAGGTVTLVESEVDLDGAGSFTNPVLEIACGPRSRVRHIRLQELGPETFRIGALAVRQEEESTFESTAVDLGGRLVRNELFVHLAGAGCHTELHGIFLTKGTQLVDNHTRIDHAAPGCESHQLFKGVLDDASRGVFDGKILVRRAAQKTDAFQTARSLLVSNDAVSYAKPQLEIYADDVKCSHGATTGQLDAEQIFYLRARGLDMDTARSLLTYAFAREVADKIGIDSIRATVDRKILARLPMGELVGDAL